MKKNILLGFIVGCIFFLIYFVTLPNYGISWDSATHFKRGQAYLHYYLTGKTDYKDITGRKSIYQNDIQDGKFWLNDTKGHPPLNDNLAALSNYIFFQQLGLLGDVESYNLFIVLASSFLVFMIAFFVSQYFGKFIGVIAGVIVGLYPLFFAEAHFNIKDPVETAFFAGAILVFYLSLKKLNSKLLIISFLLFGLAVSVKFDAIFIPVIIFLFLVIRDSKQKIKISNNYKISFLIGICLAFGVFYLSWPALWGKGVEGIKDVLSFYKSVGSGTDYQPVNYYFLGFNLYPILAVVYTTPFILTILAVFGTVNVLREKNNVKRDVGLLFVIWFLVSVLRVSVPNTSIYGGLRQIMQYVPSLAVLSAIGIYYIKGFRIRVFTVGVLTISLIIPLITYHNNENLYFNFLIGGLKGASERNFPSWGNSFGNVYKSGVEWVNENAEEHSQLTILQGELINAPKLWVREDIEYSKSVYSGNDKKGEYIMELNFNDTTNAFSDRWNYVKNNLSPVKEIIVDSVPVLFIWKNDTQNSF